ncbi:YtxH domain-containing protein [Metabacillus halosaccharovorans]|uniref:YtxH domain-containing protein n=1 Tax=Metabacillus halosaccharovorans TaxID=930124 RepID=UPI001C1F79A8|nr:YtxH domain-containing protein [Metabacillus halosaccharovorans]MBU7595059.1 YtxH domain-containing protein [Metabacillus halosaccharovorans]
MSNNKSLLVGLLVGGVIGGVATLLSTPSSGKELRSQINLNRKQIEDLVNQLKKESKALKVQLVQTAKESSEVVKEVSADLMKSIQQYQQDTEPHKENIMKEIEEIDTRIKQLEKTLN